MPSRNFGFVAATPDEPLPALPPGTPAALVRYLVALADAREAQLAELRLPDDVLDVRPADFRAAAVAIEELYWAEM